MSFDLNHMNRVRSQSGFRGKLVLYYHDEEKLTPYQILNESCTKAGLELQLKKTGVVNGSLYEHAIVIENETIITDFADNNKNAREILAPKALKILEETCYAIVMKNELVGQNIRKWDLNNFKIEDQLYRILENYANDQSIHNLIFHSNDFDQSERRTIHETASKFKLKSKTVNDKQNLLLMISKKLTLWEIVEYLIKNRYGTNYEVRTPTKVVQQTSLNFDSQPKKEDSQVRKRNYDSSESFCTLSEHYNLQRQYDKLERNKISLSDVYLLNKVKQQSGCRGKLILFQNSVGDLSYYQMIVESAQKSQLEVLVKRTGEKKDALFEYVLEIANEEITKEYAESNKSAKEILGQKAWKLLQQNCFTIIVKTLLKGRQVDRVEIDNLNNENKSKNSFYGRKDAKIIKLMGINGRKYVNDAIQGTVEVNENLRHLGLNFSKENNLESFQKNIIKYLESYVVNPCTYNLIFFNQYSVNERKIIFEASLKLKLKAKSFGKEDDRKIVISKKLTPWEIVENLLSRGDENPNYQLIRPKNVILYNYFYC